MLTARQLEFLERSIDRGTGHIFESEHAIADELESLGVIRISKTYQFTYDGQEAFLAQNNRDCLGDIARSRLCVDSRTDVPKFANGPVADANKP